jgi:hypothetical protein
MTRRLLAGLPVAPLGAVGVVAVAVWLATGVHVGELLAFAAFQAVFVVGPGLLVVRLLRRGDTPLTSVALGWPLGYALELAAFALTATVGARWLFFAYPVLVAVVAIPLLRRGATGPPRTWVAPSPGAAWATAAVTSLAMVLVAISTFASNPLPRSVPNVVDYNDLVWDVSLAADAAHRWPITDPNVSGEPLRYHVLVFWDAAAVHQATGVELDVVMFRLQPLLAVLLTAFLLAWLAVRAVRGPPWVAPAAVAIMFLANELDLDPDRALPFVGLFTSDLILSPTFAFGLVFFTAAAGLVLEAVRARDRPPKSTWVLLAALAAAAMGGKATALSVLLGGLVLFLVGRLVVDRTVDRVAATALALGVGAFVVVYVLLFSGAGGTAGSELRLFAFRDSSVLAGSFSGSLASLVATAAVTAGLFAPWLGALLLTRRLEPGERATVLWLGALVLAAVGPFVLLSQIGLAQIYFLHYATPPAAVLSAWGASRVWPSLRLARRPWPAVAALALLALLAVGTALFIHHRTPGDLASTPGRYLVPYVVLVAVLAVVALVIERRPGPAVALAIVGLVSVSLLDTPLDVGHTLSDRRSASVQARTADQRAGPRGIDRPMLAGLRWLRDHSDADDIVATSNEDVNPGDSRYFYVAAYAERRTFLEGSDYTAAAFRNRAKGDLAHPFPDRRALNAAAFTGNPRALRALRDTYGVKYLVLDLLHGSPQPALDARLQRVFANRSIRIYRFMG